MFKFIIEFYNLLSEKDKKNYFLLQLLVLLMAVLETLSVYLIAPFLLIISGNDFQFYNFIGDSFANFFIGTENKVSILRYGLFLLIVLLLTSLISIYTVSSMINFGYKIGGSFSIKLFKFYISRDWNFYVNSDYTKLIKNISQECDRISEGLVKQLFVINARIMTALIITLSLFIYNYILATIVFFVFLISYLFIYFFLKKYLDYHGKNLNIKQSSRYSIMYDSFRSFKEILLYKLINKNSNQFRDESLKLVKSRSTIDIISFVPKYFIEFIAFSSVVVISIFITLFSESNFMELLLILSIFAFAAIKILPAFQSIYICISQIKSNLPAFNSIKNDILKYNLENTNQIKTNKINISKNNYYFEKNLKFENLSYTFSSSKKFIFNDINININKNSKIGIFGETGSGKSTLTLLLSGIIPPSAGKILIDNEELILENCQNWQKKVSLVDQNTYLFNGSIFDNITLKENDIINKKQFDLSIKISQLDYFINSLPEKSNTQIGQDALRISSGQKQRIGIARALYRNTDLLILDEATSNLDSDTENKLLSSIQKIDKTVLIITHNTKLFKFCDDVYELKNQKLILKNN